MDQSPSQNCMKTQPSSIFFYLIKSDINVICKPTTIVHGSKNVFSSLIKVRLALLMWILITIILFGMLKDILLLIIHPFLKMVLISQTVYIYRSILYRQCNQFQLIIKLLLKVLLLNEIVTIVFIGVLLCFLLWCVVLTVKYKKEISRKQQIEKTKLNYIASPQNQNKK